MLAGDASTLRRRKKKRALKSTKLDLKMYSASLQLDVVALWAAVIVDVWEMITKAQ